MELRINLEDIVADSEWEKSLAAVIKETVESEVRAEIKKFCRESKEFKQSIVAMKKRLADKVFKEMKLE